MSKKVANKDFNKSMLPIYRKKQFFDIMKLNWKKVGILGLIIFAFAIPLILSHSIFLGYIPLYYQGLVDGGKEPIEANYACANVNFFVSLIDILFYFLIGLGIAGSLRIIRNLVFGEGVLLKEDFFKGIKMYWKPACFTTTLFGLLVSVFKGLNVLFFFNEAMPIVLIFIKLVFLIFVMPIMFIFVSYSIIYNDSIGKRLLNSLKFFNGKFLTNLAFIPWLILAYFLIPLIQTVALKLVVEMIVFIVLIPLFILLFHLYMTSIFDEVINKKQYPEIYRKGLANKNE